MLHRAAPATAALAAVLVTLTACQKGDDGKVAATVNGDKITVGQLNAELKAGQVANADAPAVRQAALQRIIVRKLMAKAAEKDKLDQTADAKVLKVAALEAWEASLSEGATDAAAPAPTPAEAQAFVTAHPEMFANRTAYVVDQLLLPQRPGAEVAKALEPANTMDAVIQVLRTHGVGYRRGAVQVDSLRMAPALSKQMAGMGKDQLFVLPEGPGVSINQVQASHAQPLAGPQALAVATQILTAQARGKAMRDRVEALRGDAKITYGEGFEPPK